MNASEKCPCGSGKTYAECCRPVIDRTVPATSAEALMRARYSAYVKCEVDFIVNSTHPEQRAANDPAEIRRWAEKSEWLGLEILKADKGGLADDSGTVEFIARYADHGVRMEHHELAEFRRENGEWFFYDGTMVSPQPYVREEP